MQIQAQDIQNAHGIAHTLENAAYDKETGGTLYILASIENRRLGVQSPPEYRHWANLEWHASQT